MDPLTLIALLAFMRRRGRGTDELLPLLLLMSSTGQNMFAGGNALVPVPVTPPPVPGTPPAPGTYPNYNPLLLITLLMGGDGDLGSLFGRRRREEREEHEGPPSAHP